MIQISVSEVDMPNKIDSILNQAKNEPIALINQDQSFVVIPMDDYREMKRQQMMSHISRTQDIAEKNGLTGDILSEILNEK